MLILLPFMAEKLADVERNLTGQLIRSEMKKMSTGRGLGPDIFLPRFKIECETDLKESLRGLGVVSIFDSQLANLSGMIKSEAGCQNQGYACYIVTRTYTEKVGLIDWRIEKGKRGK